MEENSQTPQNIPGVKVEENKEILPDIHNIKQKESFTLPSRGIVYRADENIPESITLRRMTTKEEKIRLRNQSETEIIKDLLQACILNEKVNAGSLKLMDANYLLFKLRVISLLDDKYKVRVRCPHCGAEFVHELNLSEIPVNYVEQDILEKLTVKLPISQQTITLRYPSLDDLIKSGKRLEEYFNMFPNVDRMESVISASEQLNIETINGQSLMSEEIADWYDNLDIVDYKVLQQAIQKLDNIYGFDDNLKTICPKCNKEVTHGLPITGELFNPSSEDVK